MQIKTLKLKDFQLFKSPELSFDKLNLITGTNLDSEDKDGIFSGNGSGKTTLLNGILYAMYGDVLGLNLKDLIRTGEKECLVELTFVQNNEQYRIIRKIPSELHIYKNGEEQKYNTQTIAQRYLDGLFGDLNKFRTYNIIDNHRGINLLELGNVSLRKTLMSFMDDYFSKIRTNLLSEKNNRERFSKDKKIYHFYLSEKKTDTLNKGLKNLQEELAIAKKDWDEQEKVVNNLQGEIKAKEKLIYFKNQDKAKMNNGYCPILKEKCKSLTEKLSEVMTDKTREIANLEADIKIIDVKLKSEKDYATYCKEIYNSLYEKIQKIKGLIMKLKEAEKFSAYKYTKEDIQLYADAIKTFDSFSAYYIMEWLGNLSLIINDLLKPINISVEFSDDKDFIKVTDNGIEMKFEQLSSGQKTFLGTIFKIAILLNEGKNEEVIIIDEGINTIDQVNFINLIEVLKNLQFQTLVIYQNCPKNLEEVNYINVERKNGESKISN